MYATPQDTVLEILKLFFKDQKTRGRVVTIYCFIFSPAITVSSDAVKLTTDMIYLFILGKYKPLSPANVAMLL